MKRQNCRHAVRENLQRTQYNDAMCRIAVFMILTIGTVWPGLALASSEDSSSQQPSAQERLNQVLDSEGGTTVYKDSQGNVESAIELPNGERRVTVQPPQSPSMNLGPPLQLNNPRFQLPPPPQLLLNLLLRLSTEGAVGFVLTIASGARHTQKSCISVTSSCW